METQQTVNRFAIIALTIIGYVLSVASGFVALIAFMLKVSTKFSAVAVWKANAVIVETVMNGITSMVLRATLALTVTVMGLII